jgi:hypothetical protein
MELPQYDQYEKWFGGGPLATHYGMNQMDLAKQFQDQKLLQEGHTTRKQELANLFDEQNNPLKIENQQISNRKLGYEADSSGVKSRIDVATEGLQLDSKQRELVQKAKQADLDMMEIQGQQWAYSPDPKLRAQGEQLLRMHKDFIKLRDTQKFTADEAAKGRSHDFAMEAQRAKNAQALVGARAASGGGGSSPTLPTTDKMRAYWLQKLGEARARNDMAAYQEAEDMVNFVTAQMAASRGDPKVGTPTITPEGTIAPRPPRPMPTAPPLTTPQPKPTQAPTASFAEEQKQYPGVPADKLREAYKRKFGVDLK